MVERQARQFLDFRKVACVLHSLHFSVGFYSKFTLSLLEHPRFFSETDRQKPKNIIIDVSESFSDADLRPRTTMTKQKRWRPERRRSHSTHQWSAPSSSSCTSLFFPSLSSSCLPSAFTQLPEDVQETYCPFLERSCDRHSGTDSTFGRPPTTTNKETTTIIMSSAGAPPSDDRATTTTSSSSSPAPSPLPSSVPVATTRSQWRLPEGIEDHLESGTLSVPLDIAGWGACTRKSKVEGFLLS